MKLTFIGAAHEVTGSCHLLEANGKNILIDCGMEQGPDLFENQELPVAAGEIDYILLTHAHIDHAGLIPRMCKHGFKGEIIATFATADLSNIIKAQKTEIDGLNNKLIEQQLKNNMLYETSLEIKSEAIKEFADILAVKYKTTHYLPNDDDMIMVAKSDMDILVNEMLGENNV